MAWTVQELFQMGAHNTVVNLIATGEANYGDIVAALERRFGTIPADSSMAIAEFREQVINAVNASTSIPLLERPNPGAYGINPNIPSQYSYTVIANLPNPKDPMHPIEIPWTINSKDPLTYNQILAQAETDLNQGFERPDKYQSAIYADLHRRDIAFRRIAQEEFGGNAPIDINVIGAYRRG